MSPQIIFYIKCIWTHAAFFFYFWLVSLRDERYGRKNSLHWSYVDLTLTTNVFFNYLTDIAHFKTSRSLQFAVHCKCSKPPQPVSFGKPPFSESCEVSLLYTPSSPSSEKNATFFHTKPSFIEYLLFLRIRYFTFTWTW